MADDGRQRNVKPFPRCTVLLDKPVDLTQDLDSNGCRGKLTRSWDLQMLLCTQTALHDLQKLHNNITLRHLSHHGTIGPCNRKWSIGRWRAGRGRSGIWASTVWHSSRCVDRTRAFVRLWNWSPQNSSSQHPPRSFVCVASLRRPESRTPTDKHRSMPHRPLTPPHRIAAPHEGHRGRRDTYRKRDIHETHPPSSQSHKLVPQIRAHFTEIGRRGFSTGDVVFALRLLLSLGLFLME